MTILNPVPNVMQGATQVIRIMWRKIQVWPMIRGWCDFFDRADGPLGADWIPGVIRRTGGFDECHTLEPYIVSGHVEGDEDLVSACVEFEDTFDRVDGTIGADWTTPPQNEWFGWCDNLALLEGGAAVCRDETIGACTSDNFYSGMWAAETSGDQYIEVCVQGPDASASTIPLDDRFYGQIRLFCQGDPTTTAKEELWFVSGASVGADRARYNTYFVNADGSYGDDSIPTDYITPWPGWDDPTLTVCLRLEVDASGAVRFYCDQGTAGATTLIASGTRNSGGHTGPYVGFRMLMNDAWLPYDSATGPRMLWVKGGGCGSASTWSDDFERSDGAVGSQWVPGVNADYRIDDGAVVSNLTPEPFFGSNRLVHVNETPLDYVAFIEVVVDGMALGLGSGSHRTQVDLILRDSLTALYGDGEHRFIFVPYLDASGITDPPPVPSMLCSIGVPDIGGGNDTNDWVPCDFSMPVTLRAESYPNGERRIYLNGELVNSHTTTVPFPTNGLHGAFAMLYMDDGMPSPRVLSAVGSGSPPLFVGHLLNDAMVSGSFPGDQYIEIQTDNVHQGFVLGSEQYQIVEGTFMLYCQANDIDYACTAVWCEYFIHGPDSAELWAYVFQQDALGQVVATPPGTGLLAEGYLDGFAFPDDPVCTLRLEVTTAGRVRVIASDDQYANAVVIDTTVPPLAGDKMGFAFMWHNTNYDSADPATGTGTSFHILQACGGPLAALPAAEPPVP